MIRLVDRNRRRFGRHKSRFHGPGEPGLSFDGSSGCNILKGSFTVLDISVGPNNYLERFHATFEQYCDGAAACEAPKLGSALIDAGR